MAIQQRCREIIHEISRLSDLLPRKIASTSKTPTEPASRTDIIFWDTASCLQSLDVQTVLPVSPEPYYSELETKFRLNSSPNRTMTKRICHICGETDTPEWRRGPKGKSTLCNACGISYAKKLRISISQLENEGYTPSSISAMIHQAFDSISQEVYLERCSSISY